MNFQGFDFGAQGARGKKEKGRGRVEMVAFRPTLVVAEMSAEPGCQWCPAVSGARLSAEPVC